MTQVIANNLLIPGLVTTSPITLNGSLSNANVFGTFTVPASSSLAINFEVSSDGLTWTSLATYGVDNPAIPKTTTFPFSFNLPDVKGKQFRARVTTLVGTIHISASVTN